MPEMVRVGAVLFATLLPLAACGETYGSQPGSSAVDASADASSSPSNDATTAAVETEAGVDAASSIDAAPVCDAGKKDGETCNAHTECCSTKCTEAHQCGVACVELTGKCGDRDSPPCCLGLWCGGNLGTTCVKCIEQGGDPALVLGIRIRESCCSRSIANQKCQ